MNVLVAQSPAQQRGMKHGSHRPACMLSEAQQFHPDAVQLALLVADLLERLADAASGAYADRQRLVLIVDSRCFWLCAL